MGARDRVFPQSGENRSGCTEASRPLTFAVDSVPAVALAAGAGEAAHRVGAVGVGVAVVQPQVALVGVCGNTRVGGKKDER